MTITTEYLREGAAEAAALSANPHENYALALGLTGIMVTGQFGTIKLERLVSYAAIEHSKLNLLVAALRLISAQLRTTPSVRCPA